MDKVINHIIDGVTIFFSKEAFNNWQNSKGGVRTYLDKHINYLKDITITVRKEFEDVNGFYVSSTWRPFDNDSPHYSGRGLDVSRIYINGDVYFLQDTYKKLKEWTVFKNEVYKLFEDGNYNQVISPFGLKDLRKDIDKETKDRLIRTHSDHFHLNIPK